MKSTFITLTAVASLVGYSNAAVVFKDPWSQSRAWKAGEKADIKWTSDSTDTDKLCDIQMLNGDSTNSNIVATVTNPDQPVKCGVNEFEIVPLNDFKTGRYWLRIGQAKADTWTYSGVFNFEGKGTAYPLKLADGTESEYPTAEAPKNDGMTKKEKKKEEKMEEKKEKKKEEKKERKEAAPKVASQGSSIASATASTKPNATSSRAAAASNGADSSKSSFLTIPTNSSSNSKGNVPVKKDTKNNNEHDKKANSAAAASDKWMNHAVVMGLASLAAYALA